MVETWLDAGRDLDAFWTHTLREIDLILRSTIRILEREQKLRRAQNYELAQLIALAVNNPKELPTPDAFLGEPRQKRYAGEDDLRAFFMARVQQEES